ncbi:MAG: TetR/AcrR family transcriptional regulator [Stackebrandtia sp.]
MEPWEQRRSYNSLRRVAQADRTQADIAVAARRIFLSRGWTGATVRDVASEAGVSVPTVYAAYGNKKGLVRALVDAADLAAEPARALVRLETAGPSGQLAEMAGYDRRLFERSGDLIVLLRDAGRSEPDLAEAYRQSRAAADRIRVEVFSGWPGGALRPGLDITAAVDVYAVLCNIDTYATLTVERGWSPERVEQWWAGVLARELLAEEMSSVRDA